MWSYYGSKSKLVRYYPKPRHEVIIEPFAGAAHYSYLYFHKKVILIEKYEVIYRIWKWLISVDRKTISDLPRIIKFGESLDNLQFPCQEAKWLLGFMIAKGVERPRTNPTERATTERPNNINFQLQRVAKMVDHIRHWEIIQGDYRDAPDIAATWFVDAPYQFGGHSYVHGNKDIDFPELASWCRSRKGQVIVCENTKSNWLPFRPLANLHGNNADTTEAIWIQ